MNVGNVDEFAAAGGTDVGVSDQATIDQERINRWPPNRFTWTRGRSAGGQYRYTTAR